MAWKKYPNNRKRFKVFSGPKVKQQGPSLNAVFSGRGTIPLDAEATFKYRGRGGRTIEKIEDLEWLMEKLDIDGARNPVPTHIRRRQLFNTFGNGPHDAAELSAERAAAQLRRRQLQNVCTVQYIWNGETRGQHLSSWNCINLVPGYFFTKLFFEGHHYVCLQMGLDGLLRRSIVYKNRETLMRDHRNKCIVWAEVFDLSSEPALAESLPAAGKE